MKHLKTYQQLNELHQDTIKSAWSKVSNMDQDKTDSFVKSYKNRYGSNLHPAISGSHTELEANIVQELSRVMKPYRINIENVRIDDGDEEVNELDQYSINDGEHYFLVASMEQIERVLHKMLCEEYIYDHGIPEGVQEEEMMEWANSYSLDLLNNLDDLSNKFGAESYYELDVDGEKYIALYVQ